MNAMMYLLITQVKNRILSLKKKPAFLILYGVLLVMIVFSVVMMLVFEGDSQKLRNADERILFLIIAGVGIMYLWVFTNTGLSTGSSLFSMSDVGLLFVAPISTKKILMYGLLSTLGKSLFASIFIFYQIGNLKIHFGYGFKEIFALFVIAALMILLCQLISIGVYIFSNGNSFRKNIVKIILGTAIGALLLTVLWIQRLDQVGILEALMRMVDSQWFGYVPVAGWATMFFVGVVHGSVISVLIGFVLFLIAGILVISLLTVGDADYYEDVLLSTEVTYQARSAVKEGRSISRPNNKKIKVAEGDRGIGNGIGSMTLAYKHILEMRRKSKFIFLDSYSLFMIAGIGIAGYNFRNTEVAKEAVYGILAVAIYIQFFYTIMGKLKMELMKPYIFLIPEKSIKKVFAASVTSLIKPCVDGVCMFAVLAIVGRINPLTCIFLAFAYAASGAVFVGLTILYQKVLGGQPNKIIQMLVGVGLLLSIMSPSIGASVAASFLLPEALIFLTTLPYTIFCLLFATLIFVTCGNLIDKAEYTGRF